MIRSLILPILAVSALAFTACAVPALAVAQPRAPEAAPKKVAASKAKKTSKKESKKDAATAAATNGALELGKFGEWGAYIAGNGTNKVCFALSQPKERLPKGLTRDPAYIFITSRPAQNVKNEVSFMLGFAMKAGVDGSATIDGKGYALETKDKTAFVKNAAEESRFVEGMRGGTRLSVKTTSLRGHVTTDNYSLSGLGKALDKVQSDCK